MRTVEPATDALVVDVRELVGGDNGRTDRGVGIKRLAHQPLTAILLELPVAGADVVSDSVASDELEGVVLGAALASLTDNDAHLNLEVEFLSTKTQMQQNVAYGVAVVVAAVEEG